MNSLLGVLSFMLLIGGIVAIIVGIFWMLGRSIGHNNLKRPFVLFIIGVAAIPAALLLLKIIDTPSSPSANKLHIEVPLSRRESDTNIEAPSSLPSNNDEKLFMDFYTTIMAKMTLVDNTCRPFMDALHNKDLVGAAAVAKRIKDQINRQRNEISELDVPDLSNSSAQIELKEARDMMASSCLYQFDMLYTFLDFVNNSSSAIASVATIKDDNDKSQGRLLSGIAKLFSAADKLGIPSTALTASTKKTH